MVWPVLVKPAKAGGWRHASAALGAWRVASEGLACGLVWPVVRRCSSHARGQSSFASDAAGFFLPRLPVRVRTTHRREEL